MKAENDEQAYQWSVPIPLVFYGPIRFTEPIAVGRADTLSFIFQHTGASGKVLLQPAVLDVSDLSSFEISRHGKRLSWFHSAGKKPSRDARA